MNENRLLEQTRKAARASKVCSAQWPPWVFSPLFCMPICVLSTSLNNSTLLTLIALFAQMLLFLPLLWLTETHLYCLLSPSVSPPSPLPIAERHKTTKRLHTFFFFSLVQCWLFCQSEKHSFREVTLFQETQRCNKNKAVSSLVRAVSWITPLYLHCCVSQENQAGAESICWLLKIFLGYFSYPFSLPRWKKCATVCIGTGQNEVTVEQDMKCLCKDDL